MSRSDATSKPKRPPSAARQFLEREASGARARLDHALHPRRGSVSATAAHAEGAEDSEDARAVVQELREELKSERHEVLEPLLRRMVELADRLEAGVRIPPKVIGEGIDLWQTYVNRLHDVHIGQFAAARSSMPHDAACTLPLVELEQDPKRAELRIGELRLCLAAYEARSGSSVGLLSAVLSGSAKSELAWENFEEDFATSCLPDHLTTTTLRQWTTSLIETRAAGESTRKKVQEYLGKTASYVAAPPPG